jgi:predicted O-methyltransferase YrrM
MSKGIRFATDYAIALVLAAYLFAIGWVTSAGRGRIRAIAVSFGLRERPEARQPDPAAELEPETAMPAYDDIPLIDLSELVGNDMAVSVIQLNNQDGGVGLHELVMIAAITQRQEPGRVFEIGTFEGRTTVNIGKNAPGCHVFTLDLPPEQSCSTSYVIEEADMRYVQKPVSGHRIGEAGLTGRVTQVYGDSGTFDFTPYERSMDMVFVDGAHSYDYVLNDSRLALRLIAPGGVVMWHDYRSWDGVTRALNELRATERAFRNLRHIRGTSLALLLPEGDAALEGQELAARHLPDANRSVDFG